MKSILTGLIMAFVLSAAGDYFPLAVGNEWTFRNQRGGLWTVRVAESVEAGGQTYFRLDGYAPQTILARIADGDLVRLEEESGKEVLVTGFSPARFTSGAGMCHEEGKVQKEPVPFPQSGRTIPALEIVYRISGCADAGIERELFAANLGLVRRVSQSIAGPVTYDLVRARLGGVSFQGAASTSVSVQLAEPEALIRPSQSLRIKGSISADVQGPEPLDLEFRSSQRFDVALVSAAGERVWVWSATRLFAAVVSREPWMGSRSFDWELEIPAAVADTLPAGIYRVDAWITASGPPTVLGAAAPLRIGR